MIQIKRHYTRYTDSLRFYGLFLLEAINSLNLYSPNYATSTCIKKILAEIRREVENVHTMEEATMCVCQSWIRQMGKMSKTSE